MSAQPAQVQPGQVVFSHGNSFPASTYNTLLDELVRLGGHEIQAIRQYGHDPRYPVSDNWGCLAQELTDFCLSLPLQPGQPRYLVGHSMGGMLSLMAAARTPGLADAVIMLDSPVVGGWRAALLRLGKLTPYVQRFSPGATSHRRRQEWPSLDAVQQHFASKPVFASWHPQALRDYVETGTRHAPTEQQPYRRLLAFDREVETRIYGTLPDNLGAWLRRHPLQCPVAFIGGSQSREMRQVGMGMTRKIAGGRVYIMPEGTHLFPMERPAETARMVQQALTDLQPLLPGSPG